ncbi:hypothetical protein [Flavobacterium columnare]|uniref:hypothetical protein n=1 Tax=Flavobacterium columnare TaxID=996 RepID=UPI001F310F6B|nr:hypothetical protein [Flavobacterium columnare]
MAKLLKLKKRIKIKKIVNFFYFILLVGVLSSCKSENKRGILKTYYPKEMCTVFCEYIIKNNDTVLDGKFIVLKNNGKKIKSGSYKNGKQTGLIFFYFENGNIKSIDNRDGDKFNLETIFNYESENVERYILYDDFGKSFFIIYYNEKGNVTKYKGYPILETNQYKFSHPEQFKIKEQQYLKVGDKLKYSYLIANIPNAKRSFKIENISVDNSKVKRTLKHIEPCQWDVEEILTKKGKNTIRSMVKYEFKDKVTPVFIDTLSFDIEVH